MTLMRALVEKTRHKGAGLRPITHLLQTGPDGIFKNENDKISFRPVSNAEIGFFFFVSSLARDGTSY